MTTYGQPTLHVRDTSPSAMAVPEANRPSRKWIRRRIEQLDPYVDHQEIWALSYLYNITDFDLDWAYAVSNPHLGLTQWGTEAAYRGGEGAMIVAAESRLENTNDHMLLWAEHGPDSPVTEKSIDIVNKLHVKWAKRYPGAFSHSDDYIYLFSDAATAEHALRRSLGLPGWSEKQKIAAHRYWCGIAALFTVERGAKLTDVEAMPDSFEAMAAYAEEYVSRPWPDNPDGLPFSEFLVEQFARKYFKGRLVRPFGRAFVTTFFAPSLFRVYKMKQSHWAMRALVRWVMRARIMYFDYVRADEKEPITERRRRRVAEEGAQPSPIDTKVHRAVHNGSGGGCPHMDMYGSSEQAD
jgi:hypothetical protein